MASEKTYFTKVSSNGGRPKLVINEEGAQLVTLLAGYMCTDEEIAASLHVTVETLLNRNNRKTFLECKKRGVESGKASLRRRQFKLAEKSASMAIWLGKQYLGQKDNLDITASKEGVLADLISGLKEPVAELYEAGEG